MTGGVEGEASECSRLPGMRHLWQPGRRDNRRMKAGLGLREELLKRHQTFINLRRYGQGAIVGFKGGALIFKFAALPRGSTSEEAAQGGPVASVCSCLNVLS